MEVLKENEYRRNDARYEELPHLLTFIGNVLNFVHDDHLAYMKVRSYFTHVSKYFVKCTDGKLIKFACYHDIFITSSEKIETIDDFDKFVVDNAGKYARMSSYELFNDVPFDYYNKSKSTNDIIIVEYAIGDDMKALPI